MRVLTTTVLVLTCLFSSLAASAFAAQDAKTPPQTTSLSSIYKLGSGDKMHITVYGEPDLSGDFAVDGQGNISMPLIGAVAAANMTADDLAQSITSKLKQGYLLDPKVSIEVTDFRPYYIMGEVNKPGEYPYANGLNVINAVARAEGFTYRAVQKRVFIKHSGESTEEEVALTPDLQVMPGDTIRIAERHW